MRATTFSNLFIPPDVYDAFDDDEIAAEVAQAFAGRRYELSCDNMTYVCWAPSAVAAAAMAERDTCISQWDRIEVSMN